MWNYVEWRIVVIYQRRKLIPRLVDICSLPNQDMNIFYIKGKKKKTEFSIYSEWDLPEITAAAESLLTCKSVEMMQCIW